MEAVKIREYMYWVGAIDWNIRNFHGYTTNSGSTYNSYLIIDEKITLIDGVKATFSKELIERVSKIVPLDKIDLIVSNHVEMDHSGAIPEIMKYALNAQIVTSSPNGLKGLSSHFGEYPYIPVKAGDTISLGKRSLTFVPTPMLHWPDSMVTYCPEEKILFSNDAFGQHFASTGRYDDTNDMCQIMHEAKKYYANILMLFGPQAKKALATVNSLDLELIAPSHGIMWRSHIPDILKAYEDYADCKQENVALVIYDSMWHSTETMAVTITEAFSSKNVTAKLIDLKNMHISDIMTEVLTAKYIVVGSPTLNNQMLPTVASFLTYLKGLSPKSKKGFAFGSYGWGGQSIGLVEDELRKIKIDIILEMQRNNYIPSEDYLKELYTKVQGIVE